MIQLISGKQLFVYHTTYGYSLTDSLIYIKRNHPNTPIWWASFFKEARIEYKRSKQWDFEQCKRIIGEAINDSEWNQSLDEIIKISFEQALFEINSGLLDIQ